MVKQITVSEIADLPAVIDVNTGAMVAGDSAHHMSQLCAQGKVKAVKFGGRWHIDTAALLRQLGIGEGVNA